MGKPPKDMKKADLLKEFEKLDNDLTEARNKLDEVLRNPKTIWKGRVIFMDNSKANFNNKAQLNKAIGDRNKYGVMVKQIV